MANLFKQLMTQDTSFPLDGFAKRILKMSNPELWELGQRFGHRLRSGAVPREVTDEAKDLEKLCALLEEGFTAEQSNLKSLKHHFIEKLIELLRSFVTADADAPEDNVEAPQP